MRKTAVTIASLAAVVGALAFCGPSAKVPPHMDRIQYLQKNLDTYRMEYSPYFEKATFFHDDERGGQAAADTDSGSIVVILDKLIQEQPFVYRSLTIYDTPLFGNDGTIDRVTLIDSKDDESMRCVIWADSLPAGLRDDLNAHYRRATEAVYLGLTDGKTSFKGSVSEKEFRQVYDLCKRGTEETVH